MQAAVNFALYSSGASGVTLCLFSEADLRNGKVSYEVCLDSSHNKTGDVWHVALPQVDTTLLYGQALHDAGVTPPPCHTQSGQFANVPCAGFRLQGEHESEQVIDHCTLETFESMQSEEESVTVVNPGQRYKQVR